VVEELVFQLIINLNFFFRTNNVTGSLTFPSGINVIMPGDSVDLVVTLNKESPITLNVKVILREGNITIGAGVITELYSK